MAEAHPVAYQWVVEAKARGATIIHVDPHYSRTSALADLFVPLRAGHRHRVPRRRSSTTSSRPSRTSASTSSPTPTRRRSSARTSTTPTPTGSSPASTRRRGSYDPDSWQYDGALRRRRLRPARPGGRRRRATGHGRRARAADDAGAEPKLDETLQHPRCVWQILKRHYAVLHAGDGRARLRRAAGRCSPRSADLFVENSGRERTTAFVHGVGWTQHTIGSQYIRARLDPAAAARQHGPARRRRDGDARPRLDPGLERHPDALRHPARLHPDAARPRPRRPRRLHRGRRAGQRASGATCATTSSAC